MTTPEQINSAVAGQSELSDGLGPLMACKTERDSWDCKNMQPVDGDTSMSCESYSCNVCGRRMVLDYDEMR